jgi:hypothetical protein
VTELKGFKAVSPPVELVAKTLNLFFYAKSIMKSEGNKKVID